MVKFSKITVVHVYVSMLWAHVEVREQLAGFDSSTMKALEIVHSCHG